MGEVNRGEAHTECGVNGAANRGTGKCSRPARLAEGRSNVEAGITSPGAMGVDKVPPAVMVLV